MSITLPIAVPAEIAGPPKPIRGLRPVWLLIIWASDAFSRRPLPGAEGRDGTQTKTALLPAPFWCTYAWNRPTSTGAGGSDPLWLCWRGKPWSTIH